jgi:disulfide bond formation protein DsbB
MQSPLMKTVLSFVGIPLALFGPFLGAYMAYWVHALGPVTPKRVETSFFGFSDPLEDLRSQDTQINVVATSAGAKVDNLSV